MAIATSLGKVAIAWI